MTGPAGSSGGRDLRLERVTKRFGSVVAVAVRPPSIPLGRRAGLAASLATSRMVSVRLVPGAEKMPSANFTSPASTLNMWAAIARALVTILSVATWNAELPMVAVREPPVPSPKNTWSVSPWMYCTSLGSRPSRSHTSCL